MAEDFLSRWSRRKIEVKHAELEEQGDEAPVEAGEEERLPADLPEGEAQRHPAEDIDIESLTKDSNFTVFMQKGVPAALKQKALRKLWTSDPVFANLDGLDDYFDLAKPKTHGLGPIRGTSWRVGRGFLTDLELGIEPEKREAPDDETPVAELEADPAVDIADASYDAEEPSGEPAEQDKEAEDGSKA